MKLLFTGDINFRGIKELDYNKSLEILKDMGYTDVAPGKG